MEPKNPVFAEREVSPSISLMLLRHLPRHPSVRSTSPGGRKVHRAGAPAQRRYRMHAPVIAHRLLVLVALLGNTSSLASSPRINLEVDATDVVHGIREIKRSNSVTKTSSRTRRSARSSADISGIRSPRLCFGCAWQACGLRVEGGRQTAAKLAVVSHDQAVGKSALAILPVEKCLLQCSLVLER